MKFISLAAVFTVLLGGSLAPLSAQTLGGCAVFPANNIWNTPIDNLPVSSSSSAYINSIGPSTGLHPDFGSGTWNGAPIGIPYALVNGSQAKKVVTFDYSGESDPGPYPIPDNVPIEGGSSSTGDRHVLVLDTASCLLYELWSAYPQTDGTWHAGSGAIFNLTGNQLRPQGWTSSDAAGLPVLPGLVRYDEVLAGQINHAVRFTVQVSQKAYVWPARHYASSNTSTSVPPMGQRFRLKAGFDVSSFPQEVQVILNAMKKYGIIVADNGSNWYISGAPDDRWNNDNLATISRVKGSDFEAVDESGLMVNVDSAQANVPNGTALNGITLSPSTVAGGQSTTRNTVSLVGPAPNGGAVVTLASSNPGVAAVPPTVTIASGANSAMFTITTYAVASAAQVTISAGYSASTKTVTLNVTPNALTGVSVSPSAVTGGAGATGTLTLAGPAPAGGAVVMLASNSTAVTVPQSVTIPAGSASAAFAVSTSAVASAASATISALYGATTLTASLTVNPASAPALTVTLSPNAVNGGLNATGKVALGSAAPILSITVTLSSSNPSIAPVPASVTIAAGAKSATFPIATQAVSASTPVTISASYAGAVNSGVLTVNPATLLSVAVPVLAIGGRILTGHVHLSGTTAAPYVVALTSSRTSAASLPATITVPAGSSSAAFSITSHPVPSSRGVTISATYGGVTKTDVVVLKP